MKALNRLKEQGKIRAIGVSNFSCAQLAEAASYGRIDSLQPPYSLFWRKVEKDAIPYYIENINPYIFSTTQRKTSCFSKTEDMHDLVIGLFINRYEFGQPI